MADKIQLRRDTAANWVSNNPLMSDGEVGIEKDTYQLKVGDGVNKWNALPYYGASLVVDQVTFDDISVNNTANFYGGFTTTAGQLSTFGGNFYANLSGTNAIVNYDSNDYSYYDQTANSYNIIINSTPAFSVEETTTTFNAGVTETTYALTGTDVDPANGTIQYKTLTANTTLTNSMSDGQSVMLMIDDGTGFTITWFTVSWVGGSEPTLGTTGYNIINLWKVNGTVYGAFSGSA